MRYHVMESKYKNNNELFDNYEIKIYSYFEQSLEKAVLASLQPTTFISKNFLQWSGLEVTYNLSNPDNSRVVNAQVRSEENSKYKYRKIIILKILYRS